MSANVLLVEHPAPHVVLLRINRPEALNALNAEVREAINTTLPRLDADPEVRCVVLAGSEKSFAAGADIKERAGMSAVDVMKMSTTRGIAVFSKPIIAAVNGFALGGGCEYALQCDIVVANDRARFGQPEIKLGLVPGAGGTQRLPRVVGKHNAMYMVLTGNMVSAQDALRMGLVCEVVEGNCDARAIELAAQIAAMAPLTARLIKEAVNSGADMALDAALRLETRAHQLAFATEDVREGIAAFIEKRQARFGGN
ncbi:enoyl-CoA hydratase-related protein [Roseomonas sp. NAR14]|uniref:Enoyl-CoA hydratase-related protein n=1 Tax=Roseomonas acroporae TaxID=2937791 RepID=A0A9X2BW37_9PROT|nr:enoyl-CoA hydratase-related protein [Roseomonas acroporae]MCK8787333.1 enoyl-CoA hydratase-related protein [Roseomonas acroporae]